MTGMLMTVQDVINEDEIVEQAERHRVWLRRLPELSSSHGLAVYAFAGTEEALVAFLLDAYGFEDENEAKGQLYGFDEGEPQ